jgi:hypothetical protein
MMEGGPNPKQKPIPPPKPTKFPSSPVKDVKSSPTKSSTEQVTFELEEPLSDSSFRQTQLTSTLTKTEECKFILRPVKSPAGELELEEDPDPDLQVRKSPMNYFVSVTSPPVTTPTQFRSPEREQELVGSGRLWKERLEEEKSLETFERRNDFSSHSFETQRRGWPGTTTASTSGITPQTMEVSKGRPKSAEFGQSSVKVESTISYPSGMKGRPKSTEFTHTVKTDETGQTSSTEIFHRVEFEPFERPESRETVHEIQIDK